MGNRDVKEEAVKAAIETAMKACGAGGVIAVFMLHDCEDGETGDDAERLFAIKGTMSASDRMNAAQDIIADLFSDSPLESISDLAAEIINTVADAIERGVKSRGVKIDTDSIVGGS